MDRIGFIYQSYNNFTNTCTNTRAYTWWYHDEIQNFALNGDNKQHSGNPLGYKAFYMPCLFGTRLYLAEVYEDMALII